MEMCGSSRPASGSEHLISHALDAHLGPPAAARPAGRAWRRYLVSILQGQNTERIAALFDATGFWDAVAADPFSRAEWLAAVRAAPSVKEGFYTVLSSRDVLPEVERILARDPRLQRLFPLADRGQVMIREDIIDLFRVPTNGKVRAQGLQPGVETVGEFENLGKDAIKERAKEVLAQNLADLAEAQDLLYADDRYAVLIVLQAMDAAGKDGTIKHVMSGVNPQGCQVFSFKKPSAEDLDHNFLWRYIEVPAGTGPDRHLQPLVLRGRAGREGPPGADRPADPAEEGEARQEVLGAAVRGHQRVRAAPGPQRHADPEVLPERLEGRAEGPVPGAAEPAGEELEVLRRPTWPSAATGTTTWPPTRTPWRPRAPRRPRGT